MRLPNGEVLMVTGEDGLRHLYDPVKAHAYYLKVRQLKGRKSGTKSAPAMTTFGRPMHNAPASTARKPNPAARARVKQELQARILGLEQKLQKLEALIKKKDHEEKTAARKSATEKRKSAKEAAKPDTAAEKAKKARDSKQYRDKNKQKIKSADKKTAGSKPGGSKSASSAKPKASASSADLKKLATKVKGQIAVAKQRLAAL